MPGESGFGAVLRRGIVLLAVGDTNTGEVLRKALDLLPDALPVTAIEVTDTAPAATAHDRHIQLQDMAGTLRSRWIRHGPSDPRVLVVRPDAYVAACVPADAATVADSVRSLFDLAAVQH